MTRRAPVPATLLIALIFALFPAPAHSAQIQRSWQAAQGEKCPDSEFTCIKVKVPLDHFGPSKYTNEKIEVVFGILPVRNKAKRKGMFVTAVGGPGASGLQNAEAYVETYDDSIREVFDIVFLDQRGVGQSGGFNCPDAVATYYQTDGRAKTPEQEKAMTEAARAFVQDCLKKLPSADRLQFYSTRQAVEDLEAFRKLIGDDRIWLYGESYGTQFAQWYAAAHPNRVADLVLDGAVDLTLDGPEYLRDSTRAFNDVLVATLNDCNRSRDCRTAVGRNAVQVYDQLARRLDRLPVKFKFPLPNGKTVERTLTKSDLETAAAGFLYAEGERMLLQRAIASAAHDDFVPLARLFYSALGLDPETLEAIPDPSYSDAAYYAVTCADYDYFGDAPDANARVQQYLKAGDQVDLEVPRMNSAFYGDLPCAFWSRGATLRKYEPGFATLIPTLVLGATTDPATPVGQGRSIFDRLNNAYLITTRGGAHVTFGRGNACPDDIVTALLVNSKLPKQAETLCRGEIAARYVPIAPADARTFKNALDAMQSAENELFYSPEYYYWNQADEEAIGCAHGGSASFKLADEEGMTRFKLTDCAFSEGFVLTGDGRYDAGADRFTLRVTVSGYQTGTLDYVREGESYRVRGNLDGKPVNLSR